MILDIEGVCVLLVHSHGIHKGNKWHSLSYSTFITIQSTERFAQTLFHSWIYFVHWDP